MCVRAGIARHLYTLPAIASWLPLPTSKCPQCVQMSMLTRTNDLALPLYTCVRIAGSIECAYVTCASVGPESWQLNPRSVSPKHPLRAVQRQRPHRASSRREEELWLRLSVLREARKASSNRQLMRSPQTVYAQVESTDGRERSAAQGKSVIPLREIEGKLQLVSDQLIDSRAVSVPGTA
eukprot:1689569-Rhodomonas_salina.1